MPYTGATAIETDRKTKAAFTTVTSVSWNWPKSTGKMLMCGLANGLVQQCNLKLEVKAYPFAAGVGDVPGYIAKKSAPETAVAVTDLAFLAGKTIADKTAPTQTVVFHEALLADKWVMSTACSLSQRDNQVSTVLPVLPVSSTAMPSDTDCPPTDADFVDAAGPAPKTDQIRVARRFLGVRQIVRREGRDARGNTLQALYWPGQALVSLRWPAPLPWLPVCVRCARHVASLAKRI